MSTRRKRRTYTDEFKKQLVDLLKAGKPRNDIIEEYDLTPSVFDKWVRLANQNGSFKEKDNLTQDQKDLIELRKINAQLQMEVDILKQAALIFGRKSKKLKKINTTILYQRCAVPLRSVEDRTITK